MNDDDKALLARLLDFDDNWHEASCKEAADRIEAQAAEIARLREALADAAEVIESCNAVFLQKWGTTNKWRNGILANARAALGGQNGQ